MHRQARHNASSGLLGGLATIGLVVALGLAACSGEDESGTAASSPGDPTSQATVQPPSDLVEDGTLTLGTDFQFPPYESIESGENVGFDVEFAQMLGETLGLDVRQVDTRFSALIPGLEAHQYDAILSALYITPDRLKEVDMIPYFNTGNVLVVSEDGDYQPKTALDICGHTFSVQSGAFVEAVVQDDLNAECEQKGLGSIEVQSLPTDTANFQQVAQGRADVTLGDTAVTTARLRQTPELGLHISSAPGKLFYPTPGGIAVLKDNEDVQRALTEAVRVLEENGQLEALRKKYALAPPDQQQVKQAVKESQAG
jgi:polar amino acid transport system substrate-binding protein